MLYSSGSKTGEICWAISRSSGFVWFGLGWVGWVGFFCLFWFGFVRVGWVRCIGNEAALLGFSKESLRLLSLKEEG